MLQLKLQRHFVASQEHVEPLVVSRCCRNAAFRVFVKVKLTPSANSRQTSEVTLCALILKSNQTQRDFIKIVSSFWPTQIYSNLFFIVSGWTGASQSVWPSATPTMMMSQSDKVALRHYYLQEQDVHVVTDQYWVQSMDWSGLILCRFKSEFSI